MRWIASALLVSFSLGCESGGPAKYPVTGKVSLDGQPLAGVSVTFSPSDRKSPTSGGKTDAQGVYTLSTTQGDKGAVVGKHLVTLSGGASTTEQKPEDRYKPASTKPEPKGGSPIPETPKSPIPEKYSTAGIEKEVAAKTNTINLELSTK